MNKRLVFPEDFFWGAATAAHQIEGNNIASDWWERENRPGTIIKERSGDAADSYHRYREDIGILADLGLQSYRFSIEWARIEPEKGHISRAHLLHYRDMIEACLERGVMPFVTLHHFTNPRWFADEGGWRAEGAVDSFSRYVETLLPILADVPYICTINESNMVAIPQPETLAELTAGPIPEPDEKIAHAVLAAHRRARDILGPLGAKTGWTVATQAYHAMPGYEEETARYGYDREDFFLEGARGDDFLGVQAYLRTFIGEGGPQPVAADAEKTLTGWEYFPPALGIGVRNAWTWSEGVPIIVTENGLATSDDSRRIDYTYDALAGLHAAMEDGIEVNGYLHWSLLDNYEWGSYRPTFGLIGWDPDTFERHPRPSAQWLGNIARTSTVEHPHR